MSNASQQALSTVIDQLAGLGARLRAARKRRGFTQELFAERIGVSRETQRRLEKGDPSIAIGTYMSALKVLGLDGDINNVARDVRAKPTD